MKTEKIIKIKAVQCHQYDGCQCETAIYAKSDSRNGYRWYVGYGADYVPASKKDAENYRDYSNQETELADAQEQITGTTVRMYRND